jgi:hypothetical protein
MKTTLALFLGIVGLAPFASASIAPRCEVKVTYHLRSGIIEEAKLRPVAKTKAECQKKAKFVKVHSAPAHAVRKVVAVNWRPKR